MFQHWTNRRKASLAVHIGIVLIPFCFAAVSAGALWYSLFRDWWVAVPIVIAFDVTALLGLLLYIAKIDSPFQVLRHLLPFISVVPLGVELYQLLRVHNGIGLSATVAFIVTTLMTLIAWRCYVTIERLFVSPEVAARQMMQEQVRQLTTMLITAADMQSSIRLAVQDWSERADIRVSALTPALTGDVMPSVSTQAVRAYAELNDVSERTVWRQLKTGKLAVTDIAGEG